jgi:peptide-methionine (S)-S-oxide reductase
MSCANACSFPRSVSDAESIRIHFDPTKVTYEDLLDMFFSFHTPTDSRWGTQYRSAIFVHTKEQREIAKALVKSKGALGKFCPVEDASDFYKAEEYHQRFLEKQ